MPVPREQLARKLVEYSLPIEPVLAELASYPWDCDSALYAITPIDVVAVIDRYLSGHLSPEQVERWADLIEARDDLDAVGGRSGVVRAVIHELANPLLSEPLSQDSAARMRHVLATSTI